MKRLLLLSLVLCLAFVLPVLAADKKKDAKAPAQPQVDPRIEMLQKIQQGYLQLQQNQGSAQDVAVLVEDYLVKYPDSTEVPKVHLVGIAVYQKLENFEKFEEHSLKAIEKLPPTDHQVPMFAITLAEKYYQKNELQKAVDMYDKAKGSMPGIVKPETTDQAKWDLFIGQMNWQIFAGLGDIHYKMAMKFDRDRQHEERVNMLKQCIADIQEANKINAKDDYSYLILGNALAQIEDYENSLRAFAKAFVLNGQMAESAKQKMDIVYGALEKANKAGSLTIDSLVADAKKELGIQ